jgi:RHS repeat-associated protein
VYTDAVGRAIVNRSRHFNGGLTESSTTYDPLGRVGATTKPHLVGDGAFSSTPTYDALSRVKTTVHEIGPVVAGGGVSLDVVTTTYLGLTTETKRTVNGQVQTRREKKNLLGKVDSVTDANGVELKYSYDADGNLTDTTDAAGNVVRVTYDLRGRKKTTVDPDMGSWSYGYNGFGDLTSQTDAKLQTTTMTYDSLGRMTTKTDSTGTAQWVYDVAPGAGKGKLAAMISAPDPLSAGPCTIPFVTVTGGNRAGRSFKYTAFGDLQEESQCSDGATFVTNHEYDALGRQTLLRYPSVKGQRLAVNYHYTSLGHLQYLSDAADGSIYWAATEMNALGQVTRETLRNGVETTAIRNATTGWLLDSSSVARADGNKLIQKWGYRYDEVGNLLVRNRSDVVNTATSQEVFTYDPLNRLKTSSLTTSDGYNSGLEIVDYDSLGNIKKKGGKTYTYTGCMAGSRTAGPHAVCTVTGTPAYSYDGNGNMTAGGSRTVTYNPANKATQIQSVSPLPASTVKFVYGADANRVVQIASSGGSVARTLYVGLGSTGKSVYERTIKGSTTEHVQFLYAGGAHGGNPFSIRIVTDTGTTTTTANKYYHFDHLGSVTAMSDERGRVATVAQAGANAGVLGYDAWGARRNPEGRPASPTSFNQQPGRREFTGHETITGVGLVNMNGRVYDPVLGRFLSPDPIIQFVADLQSYNRYSYVLNNPLALTDPTGYWSFVGGWFDQVVNAAILGASIAVCAGTSGAGCAVTFALLATAYNTTSAIQSGAGFYQVAATLIFSAASAGIGGGIGSVAASGITNALASQLVAGAISGMVSAAVMQPLADPKFENFGRNLLLGAVVGAASAGVTYGIKNQIAVSQASAAETKGGGGSGESVEEARAREQASGAAAGDESKKVMPSEVGTVLPSYEPDAWNDGGYRNDGVTVQGNSNCYAYAANKKGPFLGSYGVDPGDPSNLPPLDDVNVARVRARLKADGLSTTPTPGGRVIYLVVSPGEDYHFYRRDNNGYWSHKPGNTPVTNVDALGSLIRNPAAANHNYPAIHYSQPGGFFWVPLGFSF